jgi:hypothetical protein
VTAAWRQHPDLKDRFHPEYPDDVQVIVHDGGPRISSTTPELMWTRVTGMAGSAFVGKLLNRPANLESVVAGSEILFIMPNGLDHPIRVLPEYLAERPCWTIHPCNKCGLSELFDPPSVLIAKVLSDPPGEPELLSAFCGACGGVQVLQRNETDDMAGAQSGTSWWERLLKRIGA